MSSTDAALAQAVYHLDRAAGLADDAGGHDFAGLVRLAAATLPDPDTSVEGDDGAEGADSVTAHLTQAIDWLDAIPPLDGPADLQLSAWHIHELRRIATTKAAS